MFKPNSEDIILEASNGNPGTIMICINLLKNNRLDLIRKAIARGITGTALYLCNSPKDFGNGTIEKLEENINSDIILQKLKDLGYISK